MYPRLNILFFFSLTLLSLSSFDSTKETYEGKISYQEIFTLVNQQIIYLDSLQPEVIKSAKIGNQEEAKTFNSYINWKEELKTFTQSRIKPSTLSHNYIKGHSPLTTKYIIKNKYLKDDHYPIKKVYIQYDSGYNLKEIYFLIQKGNELIKLKNRISLSFKNKRITNYRIDKEQKTFLRKKSNIGLKLKIVY